MRYIHVKSVEKYHPGYKDRVLQWAKIYFTLVQGDPDFELIQNETDKWRFVTFIILELEGKQHIPIKKSLFEKKGFDLEKRSIHLTLKSLHNFINIVTERGKKNPVTQLSETCVLDKEEDKDKDIRGSQEEIYEFYKKEIKGGARVDAIKNIQKLLKAGIKKEDLLARIKAYKQYIVKNKKTDPEYFIQANNFFGKKERWREFEPEKKKEPPLKEPDPNCKACKGEGEVVKKIKILHGEREVKEVCQCRRK